MERENVIVQLQDILRQVLKNNDIVINEETTAGDVDGWDSLAHVSIVNAVESHFNMRFSVKEMLKWKTVGKIVDSICNKL